MCAFSSLIGWFLAPSAAGLGNYRVLYFYLLCLICQRNVSFFLLPPPPHPRLPCSLSAAPSPQQRGERVSAGAAGAARLCSVSPARAEHSRYSQVQRNLHSGEAVNTEVPQPPPPAGLASTAGSQSRGRCDTQVESGRISLQRTLCRRVSEGQMKSQFQDVKIPVSFL